MVLWRGAGGDEPLVLAIRERAGAPCARWRRGMWLSPVGCDAGPTAALKDFWKLPGGLVDPGEDVCRAAEREVPPRCRAPLAAAVADGDPKVFEETGVRARFSRLAGARETHSGA